MSANANMNSVATMKLQSFAVPASPAQSLSAPKPTLGRSQTMLTTYSLTTPKSSPKSVASNQSKFTFRTESSLPNFKELFGKEENDSCFDEVSVIAEDFHDLTAENEDKLNIPNPLEEALKRMKKTRKAKALKPAQLAEKMELFLAQMREAYQMDILAARQNKPAVHKMRLLSSVVNTVGTKANVSTFVQVGGADVIAVWMGPMPNGAAPNMTLIETLLKVLSQMQLTSAQVKRSGLGKVVVSILKDQKAPLALRKEAQALSNNWVRNIFGQNGLERKRKVVEVEPAADFNVGRIGGEDLKALVEDSNTRRHPPMFMKPENKFTIMPRAVGVAPLATRDQSATRVGKVKKTLVNMQSSRTTVLEKNARQKHSVPSVSGNTINLSFNESQRSCKRQRRESGVHFDGQAMRG